MNTPSKFAAFAAALSVAFGAALGVGNAVGPVGTAAAEPAHGDDGGHSSADEAPAVVEQPGGLQVSEDGYTLALSRDTAAAGPAVPVSFRVLGPDGKPVTSYEPTHDKDLHMIAVRRGVLLRVRGVQQPPAAPLQGPGRQPGRQGRRGGGPRNEADGQPPSGMTLRIRDRRSAGPPGTARPRLSVDRARLLAISAYLGR